MNREQSAVQNIGSSRFIGQEADRLFKRRNSTLRNGLIFIIVGVVLFVIGGYLEANKILQPPIPGIMLLGGFCMLISGFMTSIRGLIISKEKIMKDLESRFMVSGLSADELDKEMENFKGFDPEKSVFVTEHFVIQREPLTTKAVCLSEAFYIIGAFTAQTRKGSEVGYMLYDGIGPVDEHTKEGYSRIRGDFFIEYYDKDGSRLVDYRKKKCITTTGKERFTKEILQDIHRLHPYIFMGREQMSCINKNNAEKAQSIYKAKKQEFYNTEEV